MRIKSLFSMLLTLAVLAGLAYGGYVLLTDMDGPQITLSPDTGRASPGSVITLTLTDPSKIRSVSVSVRKNNAANVLLQKHFAQYQQTETLTFNFKDSGLREGAFELEIKATDASLAGFGRGNSRTLVVPMRFDTQPPRVNIKTIPPNVHRGGTGSILYTVSKDVLKTGVRIGEAFFPAYQQGDGSYACLFPYPHNISPAQFNPEIVAEDLAGNVTMSRLTVRAIDSKFKRDTINVSDDFLNKVAQAMGSHAPEGLNPLERFLYINRDVRMANEKFLWDLGQKSEPSILWRGAFTRLPRSAARAGFADHRTYVYNGQKVDEQYHMGFDLASLTHADVPAANNGKVVYSDFLGIYGNLVVIDHGMGLMSLYSHLSDITTSTGSVVAKGDIIGHTGTTGMAFGDHLHFGILVGGIEVQPIEWLDPKWIKNNVTDRFILKQ